MVDTTASQKKQAAAIYNDSLARCVKHPGFLDRFYELFLASSDEVAEKFKNTDFKRQKEVLKTTLFIVTTADCWWTECDSQLDEIAQRHSRDELDIRPGLYDLWQKCLLQAVSEADPQYNAEVEAAWKGVLGPVIGFMKSRY